MHDSIHDIDVLNDLIEITVDSYDDYREAAEQSKDAAIACLFSNCALDRRRALCTLRHAVEELGGRPVVTGTLLGSARRVAMDLRALLGETNQAVIEQIERGDDYLKGRFEHAMEDFRLSEPIRNIVKQAYVSVQAGHDAMCELKQASS